MTGNVINICLACDNNYVQYASVVMASALSNANQDDILAFYILDGGIEENNKQLLLKLKNIKDCSINFVNINEKLFEQYEKVKTHSYISIATFYRLKLPSLLQNINKIIYFDCDFVINSSLKELFNVDLENYPVGGVLDIKKKMVIKNPTYVNAGMLILDLNKMRELDLENEFLNWTAENFSKITCGDQEIINEVCRNKIKILENEWNVQSSNFTNRSCYTNKPKGIHFISKKKPWHFASYSYHKAYYFKYLQLTPWALKGFDKIKWGPINQIASLISYLGYRPLFILRPKFYQAIYYTYIKPLFGGI